jgi:hypothetical protein
MNKSYVDEIRLCFYNAYVNNTDGNACLYEGFFICAWRVQNLQITHVYILVWITPFQSCCREYRIYRD